MKLLVGVIHHFNHVHSLSMHVSMTLMCMRYAIYATGVVRGDTAAGWGCVARQPGRVERGVGIGRESTTSITCLAQQAAVLQLRVVKH